MVGCVDLTLVRSPLAVSKSLKGQKKRWLDYDGNTAPDLGLFLDKCMDCVGNGARWVEVCPLWALSLILFMHLIWWSTCFHFTKSPTEVSVIVRVEMPLGWVDKLQRPQRLRELLHWFTLLCFIFYLYLSDIEMRLPESNILLLLSVDKQRLCLAIVLAVPSTFVVYKYKYKWTGLYLNSLAFNIY